MKGAALTAVSSGAVALAASAGPALLVAVVATAILATGVLSLVCWAIADPGRSERLARLIESSHPPISGPSRLAERDAGLTLRKLAHELCWKPDHVREMLGMPDTRRTLRLV